MVSPPIVVETYRGARLYQDLHIAIAKTTIYAIANEFSWVLTLKYVTQRPRSTKLAIATATEPTQVGFVCIDANSFAGTGVFDVPVNNRNAAPEFEIPSEFIVQEGQEIRFRAKANDPDNPGFIPQDRNAEGRLTELEGSDPSVTHAIANKPETERQQNMMLVPVAIAKTTIYAIALTNVIISSHSAS